MFLILKRTLFQLLVYLRILIFFLNEKVVICTKKHHIYSGWMKNNLYFIKIKMYWLLNTEININSKRLKTSQSNKTSLWHLRLGHIGLNRIQILVKYGPLRFLEVEPIPQCESCLEGKMNKIPFGSKGNRVKGLLQLVHSNVCGPMNVKAWGAYEYYVTFIDDYSRYGYVYLMHCKSETFDKFKVFGAKVEKQLGLPIKSLRSDWCGEYLSDKFQQHLLENEIVSQLIALGIPQQNGNLTWYGSVYDKLFYIPFDLLGICLINCMLSFEQHVPSKSVPKTPQELWTGRKTTLNHICIWGCPAYILDKESSKLNSRSEVCIFVGYPRETKWVIYITQRNIKSWFPRI